MFRQNVFGASGAPWGNMDLTGPGNQFFANYAQQPNHFQQALELVGPEERDALLLAVGEKGEQEDESKPSHRAGIVANRCLSCRRGSE